MSPTPVLTQEQGRVAMRTGRIPGERRAPDEPRAKPVQHEGELQRACVEWLRAVNPRCVWVHPANELARSLTGQMRMFYAALGLVSGAADFLLLWGGGSAAVELKSPTGKQSGNQQEFERWCKRVGVPYVLVRTFDEFVAVFKERGLTK